MEDFQTVFNSVVQVIGVAYTYQPSLAMRKHLAHSSQIDHSAKSTSFSYFYKGSPDELALNGERLILRRDPLTDKPALHWCEPELALILGNAHQPVGYSLANDLTAITVEMRGRTRNFDGTYYGKKWYKCGSIGPRFVSAEVIENLPDQEIGMKIERENEVVYEQTYHIARKLRQFAEIPDLIVERYRQFGEDPPPSKKILVDAAGFLPAGTVIMLGTGLIVKKENYCRSGDKVTIYSKEIGELTNVLTLENQHRRHRSSPVNSAPD